MYNNENQSKRINKKWHIIAASLLLLVITLSSIFFLAKMVIGLAIASIIATATKIISKAVSNVLKDKQANQNQVTQKITQDKITNLAIGLMSIFAGGLSLLILVQTGLTSACAAIAALALYEPLKGEKIGKSIDEKLDNAVNGTTHFVISSVEKFISLQSCQV
ncbi:hypothetical protein HSX44_02350 [Wolbachia endosymbiont of Onchocerca gibsoni]|uniref:hypothetical protein n=1 Tax=Wolbachia endosymbiont of Onchocerca gibsoni TaxID=118986 RepID=UPI0023D809E4|nr:hypothetical protein [Wolbachia endosymbiont of Onchocerca gibsoni]MDF0607730.1 hypothetical protein [Wolbachia endosymbiont of Onchocerca gibsoni]